MKKLLFLCMTFALFVACSDDDDNNTPITGLEMPKFENPVKPGASITIQGEGFTQASEIWFRQIVSKAADNGDVQATVTEVTATGITFTAPEVYGNQSVLLKENGKEYELGKMVFEEQPETPVNVKILPKKIKRIIEEDENGNKDITEFEYDIQGRIKSCDWGNGEIEYYTYSDNMITCRQEDNGEYSGKSEFMLENGRIKSYSWKNEDDEDDEDDEDWVENYELEYDNEGYLCKSTMTDNENDSDIETFTFAGGNLVKHAYISEWLEGWNGSIEYTYGEQLNNLNIDFFYIIDDYDDSNLIDVFPFNMIGKRSRCLPVEMKFTDSVWDTNHEYISGHETYTVKFEYEMNGEYLSKVTMRGGKSYDGEESYRIFTIEYED